MKYFILRATNEVFAYEADGSQDAYIKPELEPLSDEELAAIRAAQEAAAAPTSEQILQAANAQRDSLLAVAALRIAPLQDAVDLDEATAADKANLLLWKRYRVAVNRVPDQAGYPVTIDWPPQPGASPAT